jgi:hypothetical protein
MSIIVPVLPQLQALTEGEMLDAVTIHRPGAATANPGGAMVQGAPTDGYTVGRVRPVDATDTEAIVSGQLRQDGLEKLTLPLGTSVDNADTVTVVSARHGTTVNYTVEGVARTSTLAVHLKVFVRRA